MILLAAGAAFALEAADAKPSDTTAPGAVVAACLTGKAGRFDGPVVVVVSGGT